MTALLWKSKELREWSIVGMNHFRLKGKRMLYVAMTKDGKCIVAQGADTDFVWEELAKQAKSSDEQ